MITLSIKMIEKNTSGHISPKKTCKSGSRAWRGQILINFFLEGFKAKSDLLFGFRHIVELKLANRRPVHAGKNIQPHPARGHRRKHVDLLVSDRMRRRDALPPSPRPHVNRIGLDPLPLV